jgi:hypothetical protein
MKNGVELGVDQLKIPTLKIGTTRSGSLVVIFVTDDKKTVEDLVRPLSEADHFDAWAIFERLSIRELRRSGYESAQFNQSQWYAKLHQEYLTDAFIEAEMTRSALKTSLDLLRFAAKLTEKVFLD